MDRDETDVGGDLIAAYRDEAAQLAYVIGDALHHSGPASPRVRVGVEDIGPWYACAVADDGVGISAEGRERVWGRARVESPPGEGATIHFTWRPPREAGAGS